MFCNRQGIKCFLIVWWTGGDRDAPIQLDITPLFDILTVLLI